MDIDTDKLVEILTGVLNAPARPPALQPLARVKYPGRELYPHAVAGGVVVSIYKIGHEYKHRGPVPKKLPLIRPAAVQAALNDALPDGLSVTAVRDCGKFIEVHIRRKQS